MPVVAHQRPTLRAGTDAGNQLVLLGTHHGDVLYFTKTSP
jgi:hypothetical protein